MIQRLIETIVGHLREALQEGIDAPAEHILAGPAVNPKAEALPIIAVVPGKLAFVQAVQDGGVLRPAEGTFQTLREFQQELRIDVYARQMAEAETWASLTLAVLLTMHDDLVAAYNAARHVDAAGSVRVLHVLRQIQVLEGNPSISVDVARLQLTLTAFGQLTLVRTLTEGLEPIKHVDIRLEEDE